MVLKQERQETTPRPVSGERDRAMRPPTEGLGTGGGVLVGLVALACPLFCLGPVLLVGLAATGLGRALGGAPWLLIAGAVLLVVALGVWGARARRIRGGGNCCATPRPDLEREVDDAATR
jgi:hypothetical protein